MILLGARSDVIDSGCMVSIEKCTRMVVGGEQSSEIMSRWSGD